MKKLLLVALASAPTFASAAQTGRIAHFSYGGSVGALAAGEEVGDNFGEIPKYVVEWRADTLVYVNDSLAIHSGQRRIWMVGDSPPGRKAWYRKTELEEYNYYYRKLSPQASLEALMNQYPHAVFIGFNKLGKRSRSKPLKGAQTLSKRPFQYSYWRGLATVAALGAVGWLLGRKAKTV